ncbi:SDR family NAD(P)-dependent oxidoreductase [Pelagicoccus sp. SDUM812003]|uniref:SDR family NAD(P)-dependent oxidoreductase n=1 Tax=Pelagicoccus sp. SDUM812003 TaxID=3041267 RepID=UPI00280FA61A|nr:SDR family NAD(P)-dependent oxidoreductase [Pelagicoccus sp. SDUM812003]MDQ8201985.1 SDR family NAD(P)-dependent oxidoreductase [Pelagicoccus sp. SDUM812003]
MSQTSRANEKDSRYGLAIISGGSSGIGKSIIELLGNLGTAHRVFNLSRKKPAHFTNDKRRLHLECDLGDRAKRKQAFSSLEHEIDQSPESGPILLINNAGFGLYGEIGDQSPERHLELLEVNICALVELTTRLLPRIKQRGGSIMNIASTSAFQPTPYLSTYGASKAFVLNWTLALNQELKGSGASAHALCPGPTRTEFFDRAGLSKIPGGFSQSPEEVAKVALSMIEKGQSYRVPGLLNKLAVLATSLLPPATRTALAASVLKRWRSTSSSNR